MLMGEKYNFLTIVNLANAWQRERDFAAVTWQDTTRQTDTKQRKTLAIDTLEVMANRWRQSRVIDADKIRR